MSNETMRKFGYPATVIAETPHWSVLLRPQQVTLGSLVLACREPVAAFGQASPAAFAGLRPVVANVESMLAAFVRYTRINYLMLMMVDPDVHFHVIPRYETARRHGGIEFPDAGWPGPPALGQAVTLEPEALGELTAALKAQWPGSEDGWA